MLNSLITNSQALTETPPQSRDHIALWLLWHPRILVYKLESNKTRA